jgi:hypothetical protein
LIGAEMLGFSAWLQLLSTKTSANHARQRVSGTVLGAISWLRKNNGSPGAAGFDT